jgi:hypothetical protein
VPSKVLAMQDKKPLTKENAGLDILFDIDGTSYVLVDTPREFNLVCNHEFGEHEFMLTTQAPGLELFTFNFVTGVIPELVSAN